MPRAPKIRPSAWTEIGSDAHSIAMLDHLVECHALEPLGWHTNDTGTVSSEYFYETFPHAKEPLGFRHRVKFRSGRFNLPKPLRRRRH